MATITLVLLGLVLIVVVAGIIPESRQPKPVVAAVVQLINLLPFLMLASQFAANYLIGATPKK